MAFVYLDTELGTGLDDGTSWANAWKTFAQYVTWHTTVQGAGDTAFLRARSDLGNLGSLGGDLVSNASGTSGNEVSVIGVKNATVNEGAAIVPTDFGTLTDRPLFTAAGFQAIFANYHILNSIRFTGSDAISTIGNGANDFCLFENLSVENTGNGRGIFADLIIKVYGCEVFAANNVGIQVDERCQILFNYIHDCVTGVLSRQAQNTFAFNIIDTMTTDGFLVAGVSGDDQVYMNNTIYNVGQYAFNTVDRNRIFVINNAIHTANIGYFNTRGSITYNTRFFNNNWFNITNEDITFDGGVTDVRAIVAPDDTVLDPQFVGAGAGNFSWAPGGNLEGIGKGIELGVG